MKILEDGFNGTVGTIMGEEFHLKIQGKLRDGMRLEDTLGYLEVGV